MPKTITYTWETYGWLQPFTPTNFSAQAPPATPTMSLNLGQGSAQLGGNGVPPASLGRNGDYYFRWDAPGGVYFKSAGAWGIV